MNPAPSDRHFVQLADALRETNAWTNNEWLCRPGLTQTDRLLLVRANMDPMHCHPFHHHPHRDEIIYNPMHHFYHRGLKFCTLNVVKAMKWKRRFSKLRLYPDIAGVSIVRRRFNTDTDNAITRCINILKSHIYYGEINQSSALSQIVAALKAAKMIKKYQEDTEMKSTCYLTHNPINDETRASVRIYKLWGDGVKKRRCNVHRNVLQELIPIFEFNGEIEEIGRAHV